MSSIRKLEIALLNSRSFLLVSPPKNSLIPLLD